MAQNKPHHDAEEIHIKGKFAEGSVIFKPRALNIVWGEDNRYWRFNDQQDGNGNAELVQVCWLEVTGKTKADDAPGSGKYDVGFKVSLKTDAFGWSSCQAFLMAKVGRKGKYCWRKFPLGKELEKQAGNNIIEEKITIEVKPGDADKHIYFGLYEVWSGKWKGGLIIQEAYIIKHVEEARKS